MVSLYQRHDGTVCRACGAAHGSPPDSDAPQDVCGDCWGRFKSNCRYRDQEPNTERFNRWLARQLYLSVRRLKIYGVTGRCQAISGADSNLLRSGFNFQGGYQCAMQASMTRDGKAVCASHGRRADIVHFVDEPLTDPYRDFTRLMAELALIDDQFLQSIREAVENVGALNKLKNKSVA